MTDAEQAVQEEPVEEGGLGDEQEALEGDVEELVDVAAKRDEYLALAQRTQADFENYRKRVAKEAALAQERGVAKLARELLPALDNLDRALEAAAAEAGHRRPAPGPPSSSDGESGGGKSGGPAESSHLLEGVRLVRGELQAALARAGVESFSPLGEVFDPAWHEAMAHQPVDGAPAGTVAEVYQPGYRLGEQVIRPARVVVAA